MNTKKSKLVRYTLGISFIIIGILYLIADLGWARRPFYLMMLIVCLYNLFFNLPKQDE